MSFAPQPLLVPGLMDGRLAPTGLVESTMREGEKPGIGTAQNLVNGTGDRLYTDGKVSVVVLK